ncbi:hypothetical protein FRUB_00915 [Fimbriiglobus ruber]|uniref:Uncharacterized protein n=1 Tax=Fimbriiglobus ruber TaxID=1908690 RepID=A0A225EB05_9BACT|nr:hypothetical protein FRUB_00915 [Fimbriiglobus ruber]
MIGIRSTQRRRRASQETRARRRRCVGTEAAVGLMAADRASFTGDATVHVFRAVHMPHLW